jgi:hypothetical protein
VKRIGGNSDQTRVIAISALSGFLAPLVFVGVIVLRKVHRRSRVHYHRLNKRFQHERARWN